MADATSLCLICSAVMLFVAIIVGDREGKREAHRRVLRGEITPEQCAELTGEFNQELARRLSEGES